MNGLKMDHRSKTSLNDHIYLPETEPALQAEISNNQQRIEITAGKTKRKGDEIIVESGTVHIYRPGEHVEVTDGKIKIKDGEVSNPD